VIFFRAGAMAPEKSCAPAVEPMFPKFGPGARLGGWCVQFLWCVVGAWDIVSVG